MYYVSNTTLGIEYTSINKIDKIFVFMALMFYCGEKTRVSEYNKLHHMSCTLGNKHGWVREIKSSGGRWEA